MQTATTLQLLDANNNNISPAVCVDSLYFEKTIETKTYRMSLKNRTIVASDTMNENFSINALDIASLELPYFTVTKSTPNGDFIWQLNTSTYKVGKKLDELINDKLEKEYYNKGDTDAQYLHVDGTNRMTSHFYVGNGTNNELYVFSENSSSGISFVNNQFGLWRDTSSLMTVKNDGSIYLNSLTGVINTNSSTYSTTANSISLSARRVVGGKILISAPKVTVNSDLTQILSTTARIGKNDSSITLGATTAFNQAETRINGSLFINDVEFAFINPSTYDSSHVTTLSLNSRNKMVWSKLPYLNFNYIIDNDGGEKNEEGTYETFLDSSTDTSLYIKTFNVYAGESSKSTRHLFWHKDDTYNSINFRALISGSTNVPIITPTNSSDNYIKFKTINGNSLLGEGKLQFLTSVDISTYSQIRIQKDNNPSQHYLLCIMNPPANGLLSDVSLNYHTSLYYTNSGTMYAVQYFASSDARLKTNISEVSDSITLPAIKEFDFIDTSVHSYGYIAQELEACGHEELVSTDSSGYKKVDYNAAHSLHIAKLEKENADLKNRIEKLEKLVSSLLEK